MKTPVTIKAFIAFFISLIVITTISKAQTFTPIYSSALGSNVNGYYEYLPAGYNLPQNANKKYPIIFYFHGGTQIGSNNGNNLEALKTAGIPLAINAGKIPPYFTNGTDTFSFIIICPQFKAEYTVSDAIPVVNYIMSQPYHIDAGKVYLTGFSWGGRATWEFLMSSLVNAKKIAAFIPIEQYCYPAPDMTTMKNAAQGGAAIWALHNSGDDVADPTTCATDYVNIFNSYSPAIPAKVTISCIPSASMCGHDDTTQNYIYDPTLYKLPGTSLNVYQWLYQYRQLAAGIPPKANAGTDQTITFPVKQATLNGTASTDADGTISAYAWKKISGPISFSISNSTASTTLVNLLVAGVYNFVLTVTDNTGLTNSDTVAVTVVNPNPNMLPVANAGKDTTVLLPATSCILNGTASFDPDGDIEKYSWQNLSGPTTVVFSNSAIANPVASNLRTGVYQFILTVTDNQNAVKSDTVQVTVKNPFPNVPPVANAGTDITIIAPVSTVTLNGSASADADGIIVAYQWRKISGPASFVITSPTSAVTTVTGLTAGFYSFELSVTDDSGAVKKDSVNVTVSSSSRILIDIGNTITASPDANGNYWNNMTDGRAGTRVQNAITTTNIATTLNLVVINRIDGTYNVSANGLNNVNTGAVVGDYPVSATVDYAFADPSATNGMWQLTGLDSTKQYTVKFWGLKSGTSQRIIQIKEAAQTTWQQYDAGSNTNYNTAATFTFTGVTTMSFNIRVNANSSFGYISLVDITATGLSAPVNQPPVAHAGVDRTIVLPQDSVHLNGSASLDPEGSALKYKWVELSGPSTYLIDNDSISTPQLTTLKQGIYQVQLKVTDVGGLTGLDTVAINVNPVAANVPPVANAGADQVITHPLDSVLLTGSASKDPDGSIVSYAWTYINGPGIYQFADSSSAVVRLRDLKVGTYSYKLTVTDNAGAMARDTVNIVVNIMPTPPATDTDVVNCGRAFKIVVLGSSTAYGDGAEPIDSSWVNKYNKYIKAKNPQDSIINLAVPGYTTYQVLCPNGFVPPAGDPLPDTLHNISAALSYHPDAIIINLPTNDVANSYPVQDQQANYARTTALAAAANVPVWVTTTQPRNNLTDAERAVLKVMRDWTLTTFGNKAIDFWTTVADTAGNIVNVYNYDDTHVDNYGHYIFYTRVVGHKILDSLCNRAVPVNIPPVAKAGNDTTIVLPANSITLNATASFDSDGSIASYRWRKISGPTQFIIADTTASQTAVTALVQGSYQFQLIVTDNNGAQVKDTIIATVNAANTPPVANAGNDTTITLPSNTAVLNGSASFDIDGSISKYRWKVISGPAQFTIADTTAAKTTITGLVPGSYQLELTVTDNANAVSKDTMIIIVNPVPNIPPVAIAGNDTTIILPSNAIVLNGSASFDSDGSIALYRWRKISGPTQFTIADTTAAQTTVTTLAQGIYQFQLIVTDNTGAITKDTMMVTVNAANIPPVAKAGNDTAITLPANTVALNGATSFDSDGSITKYRWRMISGPAQFTIADTTAAKTTITGLLQGVYQLELTVTDNSNSTSKDTMVITVNAAPNIPPIARAGNDTTIILPSATANLNGSASFDSDGSISTYRWRVISGPTQFTITDSTAAKTTITNLAQGSYKLQLTVTDNSNSTSKDTMVITVVATQRILIDVGSASLTKSPDANGNYWNNMTDGRAGTRVQNAVTTANTATTVNLVVINRIDNTYDINANGLNSVNTGVIVGDYPATATSDYAFAYQSAPNNGSWQFTGLDSTKQYTIKFWGMKSGATQRVIQIKEAGQTTWQQYDAGSNTNYNVAATFTFGGVKQMTFNIQVLADDEYGYINVVDINIAAAAARPAIADSISMITNDEIPVTIYPNPVNEDLAINYKNNDLGKVEVTIYNSTMQPVQKVLFTKNSTLFTQHISVNKLNKGLYFVEIKMANNTVVKKLIKE